MSAELLPVWNEIEKYIDNGISIIPVRDKEDAHGVAKSPYGSSWKEYQFQIIAKDRLFELMDIKYNTIAVGIVGGKVSGNLEIIDIDVKYKPGIDAILFSDLKTLYPDLLQKLRIHKSPSGGYHILYRCESEVEGNQKLAGRPATKEELLTHPKNKTYNFLETRGEGGYVVAPPALGYKVVKDIPIPVITEFERQSILNLCKGYSEIIKIQNTYKPTNNDIRFYDTNPFEDFDNRCNPEELMKELGWNVYKSNNHFIWFTRPGKNKGVSISFNLQKRFFYCFTASTELDANKGYSPSNLLCTIKFNGDKKKLYADLVSKGYGKIKPKIESKLVKAAAINNKPLPKNISNDGASLFADISSKLDKQHPFGMFWIDSAQHGIQIDRELLYRVCDGLGFKLYEGQIVQCDDTYINEVDERFFFDTVKEYIQEEDADLYKDICNAYEVFIEKHGKFTISRLAILPEYFILQDTKTASYKYYLNGILKITAEKIELLPKIDKLIWKKSVQNRNYNFGTNGKYIEFLKLSTDYEKNEKYILNCIGYLAHEFKDETAGYIIVLTEQCENPKEGGGAGKNVFSELFKKITSFVGKPGSQVKYDEKFLQSWNGQKIFCLSDVPKNFNYLFLKELSTGTGIMKKLFKDEIDVTSDKMPKFLIQTNYSCDVADGGLKRRIRVIEFTDFFTKSGGIDVYFDAHFPNDWNETDWAGFDTIMAKGIQYFINHNRKIGMMDLSGSGWVKQFEQTWGQVIYHFIKEYFPYWTKQEWISNDAFKQNLDDYYRENNTPITYRPSMMRINNAIKEYADWKNIQYHSDIVRKINSISARYRWFGDEDAAPF